MMQSIMKMATIIVTSLDWNPLEAEGREDTHVKFYYEKIIHNCKIFSNTILSYYKNLVLLFLSRPFPQHVEDVYTYYKG